MIDHLGITCADLDASARFYDATLAVLGHRRLRDVGGSIGYGSHAPDFWISRAMDDGPNRESHLAFSAPSADAVRQWFEAATSLGAEVLHAPRFWPEYHDGYFGAFVRDPDGNNLEAVCHHGDV